jgi:hypothetical protein
VPEPSSFAVGIAIAKLKMYKSTGCYQISAKLIRAGGEKLRPEIHKFIKSF